MFLPEGRAAAPPSPPSSLFLLSSMRRGPMARACGCRIRDRPFCFRSCLRFYVPSLQQLSGLPLVTSHRRRVLHSSIRPCCPRLLCRLLCRLLAPHLAYLLACSSRFRLSRAFRYRRCKEPPPCVRPLAASPSLQAPTPPPPLFDKQTGAAWGPQRLRSASEGEAGEARAPPQPLSLIHI